ncbi:MAG: tryptophan synthase subunit alpha [Oscillospiraceae bacterium]|nr:tryptophan synthase subunit alpha [Oscillospiraceae bacterium]
MRNRIDQKFEDNKARGRKTLIGYLVAGDGGIGTTEEAVLAMEAGGVDIVEIGVPFSDPIAEGKVIQEGSLRALRDHHTTLRDVFALAARLRSRTQMPLLLMLYANTIFRSGKEEFFRKCRETGIDGVIVPDLPFEEHDEFQAAADANGLYQISLVTPASKGRIARIAGAAQGFLYCVSSNGVTGMRDHFDTDFTAFFDEVRASAKIPCCVGFGIRNGEAAGRMGAYCDGVIVGSAFVNAIGGDPEGAAKRVQALSEELRAGLDA